MPAQAKLKRHLLLTAILLLAFALRVAAINRVPPGLSHDEANNGMAALQVLGGQWPIFFEINKGIEPLIIYLEALAFYAFGIGPVQLRLVNIFAGVLTVALIYPLTVRLFNRRVARLAMAGLAVSFWAVFVSRLTLRAVLLPPLLLVTLYFLWRALAPRSRFSYWAISGMGAGAAIYTYLSARFIPLLALAVFAHQLLRRQITRRHWAGLLLHLALIAVLVTPLAGYYWQNAAGFSERAGQVSTLSYLLNGDIGPTLQNTLRTLGMFTGPGDTTDRYNLDGRPVFDPINGLLFYLGLALMILRLRRPAREAGPAAVLLLWLPVMLLPDFITDDSPHFLRTIGAQPAVYVAWAVGLDWLTRRLRAYAQKLPGNLGPMARLLPAPLLVLLTTLHTGYDYFYRWANAAEARLIYGADMAQIAVHLKTNPDSALPVISSAYYRDLDQFRFRLHFQNNPPFALWFDGQQSLALPPPGSGLRPRYFFAASTPLPELWASLLQAYPAESGRDFTVYRPVEPLPPLEPTLFAPDTALDVTINDDLRLTHYRILGQITAGGKVRVLLGWQPLRPQPPGTDLTFLVQLRDRQGHLWAAADGNGYPPVAWQPGVQALQLVTLRLEGDLPPRQYQISVQVVNRATGQSLPTAAGETAIVLAAVAGNLTDNPADIDPARLPNPTPAGPLPGDPPLALRGYRLNPPTVKPGDTLVVTLHWQVLQPPEREYRLQFYAAGPNESSPVYAWPQMDPIGGEWPTTQWPAAYWVQDQLDLPVPANFPAGRYRLWLRWLAPDNTAAVNTPGLPLDWFTAEK